MISTVQSEAGPSRIPRVSSRPASSSRSRTRVEEQTQEFEGCDSLDSSSSDAVASLLASEQAAPRSMPRSTSTTTSSSSSSSSRSRLSSFTLLSFLATLALAFAMISHAPMQVSAQVSAGEANNLTSLMGTWSTGTAKVSTGINFYNPVNTTFNIPASAGQSYSFTDDGYWEQALYIYTPNPSKPSCVSASLFWQHGTWTLNSNNSLTLTPFNGDGRQLTEDRCSSTSTTSSYYYQSEYMLGFDITLDLHFGRPEYRLQLYAFDGALKPVMWQTYNPPQMLPNELLVQTIYGQTS